MSSNPFQYGSIVKSDEFCERQRLSRRLTSHFRNGQNSVVMGPRRVGKSSLIHYVASKVKNSTLIYVDLWGVHTFEDFIRRCIQGLDVIEDKASLFQKVTQAIPGISIAMSSDPITGMPTFSPAFSERKKAVPETIAQMTKLWLSLAGGKEKIIVALDEFQDVVQIDQSDQLLGILRKEIQLISNIPICFSGSVRTDMWKIFADDRGPFYKSCSILEVSETEFDDWKGYLRKKFTSTGIKIEDEQLDQIIDIAEHNPGDTQQLCSSVWEQTKFANRRKVNQDLVTEGLLQVFADERKGYEQIVSDISGQQLAVLRAIAHLGGASVQSSEFLHHTGITHASSSKAAATRLIQRRILQPSPEGFRFSNPYFKAWLLHVRY